MVDAPEWIRVAQDGNGPHGGFWTCAAATESSPKYIRADLVDAGIAEHDAELALLKAENERQASDIAEFMRRLGPRWFLEQNWFPQSVEAHDGL